MSSRSLTPDPPFEGLPLLFRQAGEELEREHVAISALDASGLGGAKFLDELDRQLAVPSERIHCRRIKGNGMDGRGDVRALDC